MNLWSFIFPDTRCGWVSARVAAPTKDEAFRLVEERCEYPSNASYPIIASFMGRQDVPEGILEATYRAIV
jgi:hypothetical protein